MNPRPMETHMLKKIISGGQTGVDRAALDTAIELGLECGGWCPAGRHADDGPIDPRYPLEETNNMDHTVRTGYNVRESDGTLMLHRGGLQGGTAYAVEMARRLGKPVMAIDLDAPPDGRTVVDWIREHAIETLHVGGQREASTPGIYAQAKAYLHEILAAA